MNAHRDLSNAMVQAGLTNEAFKVADLWRRNYETKNGVSIPSSQGLTNLDAFMELVSRGISPEDAQSAVERATGAAQEGLDRTPPRAPEATIPRQPSPEGNAAQRAEERARTSWVRKTVYGGIGTALVLGAASLGAIASHWYWPKVEVVPSGTVHSWIETNGANVPPQQPETTPGDFR